MPVEGTIASARAEFARTHKLFTMQRRCRSDHRRIQIITKSFSKVPPVGRSADRIHVYASHCQVGVLHSLLVPWSNPKCPATITSVQSYNNKQITTGLAFLLTPSEDPSPRTCLSIYIPRTATLEVFQSFLVAWSNPECPIIRKSVKPKLTRLQDFSFTPSEDP